MSDEPIDDGPGRPKLLNKATTLVGGVTALVVALAGLRAAYIELRTPTSTEASSLASGDPGNDTSRVSADDQTEQAGALKTGVTSATDAGATAGQLPTSYDGDGVTMELIDRQWVVTDKDGPYNYDQLGDRTDGMTYARTTDGQYELRWKNEGGDVELSDDAEHSSWRHYYTVTPK